jgi:hypothetical protein
MTSYGRRQRARPVRRTIGRTLKNKLSHKAAEFLLAIDFQEGDRLRMLQLADRSEAGTLTAEELTEFDVYLHLGNRLVVMQSKARLALKTKPVSSRRWQGTALPHS